MATPTLADESRAQHGFYVPQFEIRIAGAGLPHEVLRDVTQLTYHDDLKNIDGFELTVNNWDATTRRFKYVGSETAADLSGGGANSARFRLFEPGNRDVEVKLGYLGDLRTMLRGTFTTLEPSFPAGGMPTLAVRGVNSLHKLRRKQYSDKWTDKKDSEIAKDIGQKADPAAGKDAKRFPMPIVVNDEAMGREPSLPFVAQTTQYDVDFLLQRARRLGYIVSIREGDAKARNPDARKTHLYFGPSDAPSEPLYKLRWGASLINFNPTLTTANQVRSVTVNGWDPATKKAISVKVTLDDKELAINKDMHELLKVADPRDEIVVDKQVHSEAEAKAIAVGILKDRYKDMVKAAGTCVGVPSLRAGVKIEIDGMGARFNGVYFVTDTAHTLGDSGYTTKFNARREVTGAAGKA